MQGSRHDKNLVAALQRHALGRKPDWHINCFTAGVYQDDVDYVQDHAKHDSPFFSHRNPTHGSPE